MVRIGSRASFTLIEILIVIAVVAILSVVVVLALNPAQLLKQAKDGGRLSDMDSLNRAVTLFRGDLGTASLGTASTTYFSLIDQTATSTAGTNCAGVGFTAPSGWNYHCVASSTERNVDGTGWMPLNLKSISYGSPLGDLPVDVVNTSSSGLYYMYVPSANGWAFATMLESDKYLAGKSALDGGYDPGRYETGSDLSLIGRGEGLEGWWTFDELSGTSARDSSGKGRDGTWSGSGAHFGNGKLNGAGQFSASASDYVSFGAAYSPGWQGLSYGGWFMTTSSATGNFINEWSNNANFAAEMARTTTGKFDAYLSTAGTSPSWQTNVTGVVNDGSWHFFMAVFDGANERIYVDGVQTFSTPATGAINSGPTLWFKIGANADVSQVPGVFWTGRVDEARLYSRGLMPGEVAAIYNAQK